jgi:anti-sigma factor RsiW
MLNDPELEAFLDEGLPPERMSVLEEALRHDPALRERVARIIARRNSGAHSVAEIWRTARISCATRAEWGQYLLGVLDANHAEYLRFHLETLGCRYCTANVADLQAQQHALAAAANAAQDRRKKYFASSAGLLKK